MNILVASYFGEGDEPRFEENFEIAPENLARAEAEIALLLLHLGQLQ